MSNLKELTDYKNTIMQRIVSKDNILKAVYYQNEDFLSKKSIEVHDVLFNNIFPFDFIPTTEEELKIMKTYITLSVTDYRKAGKGNTFRAGSVIVRVFTHKSLFKTDYGDLRVDYLISEIDELLSDERGIGIGKLEFAGMKEYIVNGDYQGTNLHYRPIDFS